jgi:hypothetical protein
MLHTNFVEKIKTHKLYSVTFFYNCTVYEISKKNTVEPGRPQITIWRMRIVCCIPKATDSHLEYVIIIAKLLQQWLQERASVLRYTQTNSLFFLSITNDNDRRNITTALRPSTDVTPQIARAFEVPQHHATI